MIHNRSFVIKNIPEMIITGKISHENTAEEIPVQCLIDTGSGYSYILQTEETKNWFPTLLMTEKLIVNLADDSKAIIDTKLKVYLAAI